MLFSLKKYYYDFAAEDGSLLGIIYDIEVRVFGIRHRYASLLLKNGDATQLFQSSNKKEFTFTEGRIQFDFSGLTLHLECSSSLAQPLDLLDTDKLKWMARPDLKLTGHLQTDDVELVIDHRGYSDYVEMNVMPRRLKLKTLIWGRVHHNDFIGTFLDLRGKHGNTRKLVLFDHNSRKYQVIQAFDTFAESEELSLKTNQPWQLYLAKSADINNEPALEGRLSSWLQKKIYEFVSGNPFENKRFGQISFSGPGQNRSATGIYEYVTW